MCKLLFSAGLGEKACNLLGEVKKKKKGTDEVAPPSEKKEQITVLLPFKRFIYDPSKLMQQSNMFKYERQLYVYNEFESDSE